MEIKEEQQRARGWSVRWRQEGESPGLPREPAASAPRGAEGRAERGGALRVSGCRGRAASPQPGGSRRREVKAGRQRAWGSEGVSAGRGHPTEFGGDRGGPLSPLLSRKFYLPFASPALEGGFWKLPPAFPSSRCLDSFVVIRGN